MNASNESVDSVLGVPKSRISTPASSSCADYFAKSADVVAQKPLPAARGAIKAALLLKNLRVRSQSAQWK